MLEKDDQEYELEAFLIGRAYLYKYFWTIFGKEPTRDVADIVGSDAAVQSFGLFEERYPSDACPATEQLFERSRACFEGENLDALMWDYTRLFIGPGKPVAPPWESVYSNSDGLIKQRCMLEVRDEYAKQGFAPLNRPTALDDSLSLELDFMYRIADRILNAESDETRLGLVDCSRTFLTNHLGKWLGPLLEQIQSSGSEFYTAAGAVLVAFVEYDLAFLEDERVWE